MTINPVATITRDILVTSNPTGGDAKQTVVVAGKGALRKTLVELVPAKALLNVVGTGGIGSGNGATFIAGLTATPIQNLSNFSRTMRRFQVDRAALGNNAVEISALCRGDVRARVRLTATIARFKLDASGSATTLTAAEAFTCFSNNGASTTYKLPKAKPSAVGLEYYFALDPAQDPGAITIECFNERDSIQWRDSQSFVEIRKKVTKVIDTTSVKDAFSITGSIDSTRPATQSKSMSVVLSCRAPRLWVAETVTANDEFTGPVNSPTSSDPDNQWAFVPSS